MVVAALAAALLQAPQIQAVAVAWARWILLFWSPLRVSAQVCSPLQLEVTLLVSPILSQNFHEQF